MVLDEPNSNLDMEGEAALQSAIEALRKRKAITVLVAHRPSALTHVNKIAVVNGGTLAEFGERDDVLKKMNLIPKGKPTALPPGAVMSEAQR